MRPLLHEPDPKSISWVQSAQGRSAPRGSRLRMSADYDAERPHVRGMGIAHVHAARRLTQPAEYRIACSLHPVYMSQYLRVRG